MPLLYGPVAGCVIVGFITVCYVDGRTSSLLLFGSTPKFRFPLAEKTSQKLQNEVSKGALRTALVCYLHLINKIHKTVLRERRCVLE